MWMLELKTRPAASTDPRLQPQPQYFQSSPELSDMASPIKHLNWESHLYLLRLELLVLWLFPEPCILCFATVSLPDAVAHYSLGLLSPPFLHVFMLPLCPAAAGIVEVLGDLNSSLQDCKVNTWAAEASLHPKMNILNTSCYVSLWSNDFIVHIICEHSSYLSSLIHCYIYLSSLLSVPWLPLNSLPPISMSHPTTLLLSHALH